MKSSIFKRLFVTVLLVGLVGGVGLAGAESYVSISEVAWSGTQANWADEWLELRNTSDNEIDLTGWTLSWEGVTVHLGKEQGNTIAVNEKTIGPDEAFLLERSDDEAVASVKADLVFQGSLANSGEKLVLRNPQGEKVQVVDGSKGWMAGTSSSGDPGYGSMELVDGKWVTRKEKGSQKDLKDNPIYGTPGTLPEDTE